jgi:uncharacterized phage-associated protein
MTTKIKGVYTPSHVANFILEKAKNEKRAITQLKLLKLVYLTYGWVRAVLDTRLFDESIQAWKLGPVVPSLYHEFKRFGSEPITEYSVNMDVDGGISRPFLNPNDAVIPVMEKAWDVYKPYTAYALVSKTHEPDSPWVKNYMEGKDNTTIPDEEIKGYFIKKISEYINVASR